MKNILTASTAIAALMLIASSASAEVTVDEARATLVPF